ncbi:MAG: hypothetical protein P1V36_11600, partial [Planctomycetota bacterium]|nr:hypothetical protein [Planctomycetota bacterium]
MRRLAVCLLVLGLACLAPGTARAADDTVPAAAQAAFLRDRDAGALLRAIDAAGAAPTNGWRGLAILAADRMPPTAARDCEGSDALAACVLALRDLDLAGAQRAVRCVGPAEGRAAAWLQALLHLRRGDDGGAVGALLAPPVFEPARDAFPLALLGAALDPDDRHLLAAGARLALERAAARGRIAAIRGVSRGAAVLDPEAATRTLAFAVRVLRRMGELDEAAALVALAPRSGVVLPGTILALEAALLAWARGESAAMPTLLSGPPAPGLGSVWLALRRAARRPRLQLPSGWRHEPGLRAHAAATARLASALDRPTSAAEVASWARRSKRETWQAGAMRAFLESEGFEVVSCAGEPRMGDALLRAGLPFVVLRLVPSARGWREMPAVVHAYDRHTGLWVLDAPDGHGLDVMPRGEAAKARILAAAPLGKHALLAPLRGQPAAAVGLRLERALDEADRGALDRAVTRLGVGAPEGGAVQWLDAGHLWHRQALAGGGDVALTQAAEAVARSRRTPPALGMEAYLLGSRDAATGNLPGALAAYRTAARLDGPTTTVLLATFAAEL